MIDNINFNNSVQILAQAQTIAQPSINSALPTQQAADVGLGIIDPWAASYQDANIDDSWLDLANASGVSDAAGFHISQIWDGSLYYPLESAVNSAIGWLSQTFRPFFQLVRIPIDHTLVFISQLFQNIPFVIMIAILAMCAWQLASRKLAIGTVISLLFLVALGVWKESMLTLALVLTALVFCVILGLPLGILMASNKTVRKIMHPMLDAMQTTPSFVYLVPIAALFGIGNVPGTIVTIIFALPPLVRMTDLGIRQVRPDLIEASRAFGASRWQMLKKVQIPLALPSIMAGVNQSLMLAMSMVVVAAMISVAGLGRMVYEGMSSINMGKASIGGLGIVILAIMLDRLSQAMGKRERHIRHWWERGPLGFVYRKLTGKKVSEDGAVAAH